MANNRRLLDPLEPVELEMSVSVTDQGVVSDHTRVVTVDVKQYLRSRLERLMQHASNRAGRDGAITVSQAFRQRILDDLVEMEQSILTELDTDD